MTDLSVTYIWFQIIITFAIALVFLVDRLKPYIVNDLYVFLKDNKDIFIGTYYLYLTYELYRNYIVNKE